MSTWLLPSYLLTQQRPPSSTAAIGREMLSRRAFEAMCCSVGQKISDYSSERVALHTAKPANLAAAILGCWSMGLVPDIFFSTPENDDLIDLENLAKPETEMITALYRNVPFGLEKAAIAFNGGEPITFARLDENVLSLESSLGAFCGLNPRLLTHLPSCPADVYAAVLWPLCLDVPIVHDPFTDVVAILNYHQDRPAVVCTGSKWLASLTDQDRAGFANHPDAVFLECENQEPVETRETIAGMRHVRVSVNEDGAVQIYIDHAKLPHIDAENIQDGHAHLTLRTEANCLFFEGHFPHTPILPGVAQLHWLRRLLREHFNPSLAIERLEAVKFNQVLFPGESFEAQLSHDAARDKWRFQITSLRGKIASGRFVVRSQT